MESDLTSMHFDNTYIQYCWLEDGQDILLIWYSERIMNHGKHIARMMWDIASNTREKIPVRHYNTILSISVFTENPGAREHGIFKSLKSLWSTCNIIAVFNQVHTYECHRLWQVTVNYNKIIIIILIIIIIIQFFIIYVLFHNPIVNYKLRGSNGQRKTTKTHKSRQSRVLLVSFRKKKFSQCNHANNYAMRKDIFVHTFILDTIQFLWLIKYRYTLQ
jgi:hypothetical protein